MYSLSLKEKKGFSFIHSSMTHSSCLRFMTDRYQVKESYYLLSFKVFNNVHYYPSIPSSLFKATIYYAPLIRGSHHLLCTSNQGLLFLPITYHMLKLKLKSLEFHVISFHFYSLTLHYITLHSTPLHYTTPHPSIPSKSQLPKYSKTSISILRE